MSPTVPFSLVDVHAHHAGVDADRPWRSDPSGPRLQRDDRGRAYLMTTAGRREVPDVLWDVSARIAALDEAGVSHQVISPLPAVMAHAWTAPPGFARAVNHAMADAVRQGAGRLIALGCLPAVAVEAELERSMSLGLRGVEIGTTMGGLDLDDPRLERLWAACEARGASVFVHPVNGGHDVLRRPGAVVAAGLGMLTDTAIAAHSLVSGGVLARHPQLRIATAHGCGTFPWAYPRLRQLDGAGTGARSDDPFVRSLYADTLVFDVEHLRLLAHRFGSDRLVVGTDTPFLPDQLAGARAFVEEAVASGALPESDSDRVLAGNALDFLGLPVRASETSGPSSRPY